MPPKPTWSSNHTGDAGEVLTLRIIKLLNGDAVVATLKKALYPFDLADKINSLKAYIENLNKQIKANDIRIVELKKINDKMGVTPPLSLHDHRWKAYRQSTHHRQISN